MYHDGQFNDSRLAIMLACTAAAAGATVLNHAEAVKLIKASVGCLFLSLSLLFAECALAGQCCALLFF